MATNLVGATYSQQAFFTERYAEERALRPRFPWGTPKYESYADRLRVELAKFVKGEHPYEFDKEDY